ncbi:MAG: hypothetical protein HZB98_08130 [Bacteroidia bacterium]|nr:hypothetical protein [Bacteroidia bacterium]
MKIILSALLLSVLVTCCINSAQEKALHSLPEILTEEDYKFLEKMTKEVIDSSRIIPGQSVSDQFGPNNTGGNLIRPGGRNCYPSFWIRDYAMSLESGFIGSEEQKHMLLLTATTQCDQSWITKVGSMVPYGAVADHIRIDDGLPVYFPGTYSYEDQGNKIFGMYPPYDDQYFFIHMAWYYVKTTSDTKILDNEIDDMNLSDRLELSFRVPPSRADNHLVYTTDDFRGVDFGFRDVISITGELCFTSILKYRASIQMSELMDLSGYHSKAVKYREIASKIKAAIPEFFLDQRGMLLASTGKSNQSDVWSTALAVTLNILEGVESEKTCRFLADSYERGYLASNGNIRHVLTCDDFNDTTSWESSLAKKDTYQNGAYWGTPTGWVCYAISKADPGLAKKLAGEYISDLRNNDFRNGGENSAPLECFHPSGFKQNPVYMTTVSCPFIVFKSMR